LPKAETTYAAAVDAVALVEMVCGNFYGGDLVIKQAISEFRRIERPTLARASLRAR